MEKQDIDEIYGKNNFYNQDKHICIDNKYSRLIKLYIEDDGRFLFWTLYDHGKVWYWCLTNPEQISTKENYEMFLKTDYWGTKTSRLLYKKIIDYYLKKKKDFMC
jgi:hypothetical protein